MGCQTTHGEQIKPWLPCLKLPKAVQGAQLSSTLPVLATKTHLATARRQYPAAFL